MNFLKHRSGHQSPLFQTLHWPQVPHKIKPKLPSLALSMHGHLVSSPLSFITSSTHVHFTMSQALGSPQWIQKDKVLEPSPEELRVWWCPPARCCANSVASVLIQSQEASEGFLSKAICHHRKKACGRVITPRLGVRGRMECKARSKRI